MAKAPTPAIALDPRAKKLVLLFPKSKKLVNISPILRISVFSTAEAPVNADSFSAADIRPVESSALATLVSANVLRSLSLYFLRKKSFAC